MSAKLTPEELAQYTKEMVLYPAMSSEHVGRLLMHIAIVELERDQCEERVAVVLDDPNNYWAALQRLVNLDGYMQVMSTPPETTVERFIKKLKTERQVTLELLQEITAYCSRYPFYDDGCAFCGQAKNKPHKPECILERIHQAIIDTGERP